MKKKITVIITLAVVLSWIFWMAPARAGDYTIVKDLKLMEVFGMFNSVNSKTKKYSPQTSAKGAYYRRTADGGASEEWHADAIMSAAMDAYYTMKPMASFTVQKANKVECPGYIGYDETKDPEANMLILAYCNKGGYFTIAVYDFTGKYYLVFEDLYTEKEVLNVMRGACNEYNSVSWEAWQASYRVASMVYEDLRK